MSEHTYVVQKKCAVCGEQSHVILTKSRIITERTDEDLCVHYKDFNPYLYRIFVCEHCGYAEDEKHFSAPLPARNRKKLQDYLAEHPFEFTFKPEREEKDAVAAYQQAITYAELINASLAHQAGLHLQLGWIYRLHVAKDEEEQAAYQEKENAELQKAAELYDQSVMHEHYPMGSMTDNMAIYVIGAIYYRMNDFEKATQYLSRIIGDQDVRSMEPRVFDRARDLWQDVREKKAQG